MTTGAKVAIILGSATLLIGGGIGVYFLTRSKETTISTGGGSSTTDESGNKIQDTAKKVGDTANTLKDTTEALKGLGSAIGGFFKKDEKKEETASTGTLSDGTTIFTTKQSATGDDVPTKMSNQQMLKTYGMIM